MYILRDELNEAKLQEMLEVFCSYDFISIVEEVNHSLLDFMITMLVISLSYGTNLKEYIITLKRLCKCGVKSQMSELISHLVDLTTCTVDQSKMKLIQTALKSNFLLKQIDDNKSLLIDKFYGGMVSI